MQEIHKRSVQGFGWIPDRPDPRDHVKLMPGVPRLPEAVDLRESGFMPPVYDQGQLGSCTANGSAGMFEYLLAKDSLPAWTPSRLFIYYYERLMEGTVNSDSGALVRDALKVLSKYGVPPESEWPYDIKKFTEDPPASVDKDAKKNRVMKYESVARGLVRRVLAEGLPVVFGFTVFSSFMDIGSDGMMPIPDPERETVEGGHCVLAVGYKVIGNERYYVVRNSWGSSWGDGGYFYMPGRIVSSSAFSSDFWAAELVN